MEPEPSPESTHEPRRGTSDRQPFATRTLLHDAGVAAAVVGGLYGLVYAVPFPPFGVPGYLLIVAFDALEAVLPRFGSSAAYDAAFAGFLGVLAVVAALAASWARSRDALGGWRVSAGTTLAVVGAVGLGLAVGVFAPLAGGQYTPFLLITGVSVALLVGGRYLAFGRFGRRSA